MSQSNAELYEDWRTGAWMLAIWLAVGIVVGGAVWWVTESILYGVGGLAIAVIVAFLVTSYLLYGR